MRELSLEDIQSLELKMLEELDEYCSTHDLTLYLSGGTLLGAVRHKGFIPWDDDVDVVLSLPDFEKLKAAIAPENLTITEIDSRYFFSSTEGGFPRQYLRMYDSHTIGQPRGLENEEPIFIDIMPIAGLPKSVLRVKLMYLYIYVLRVLAVSPFVRKDSEKGLKRLLRAIISPFSRLVGPAFFYNKISKLGKIQPYETAEIVGNLFNGSYGARERMPKEEFEKTDSLEFCGKKYHVPSCWDKHLSNLYGDYMTPPEHPSTHRHFLKVFSIK